MVITQYLNALLCCSHFVKLHNCGMETLPPVLVIVSGQSCLSGAAADFLRAEPCEVSFPPSHPLLARGPS